MVLVVMVCCRCWVLGVSVGVGGVGGVDVGVMVLVCWWW